jgi:RNase adapter protein RapZ
MPRKSTSRASSRRSTRSRPLPGPRDAAARDIRLVIISGISGSGKSVALRALEDLGFYCVDNIPIRLLGAFVDEMAARNEHYAQNIGIGLDARNRRSDVAGIPVLVQRLRKSGISCEVIFLQANTDVLLTRFGETRRKHPLTNEKTGLEEAILLERDLLGPVINTADLVIDTSATNVYQLREQIRTRVGAREASDLSIQIESFGYKHGLPANADFVFDVRCLPNPYWEPQLQILNGKDPPVVAFLDAQPAVQAMINDICEFLEHWIPRYQNFQRSYLTVAIGCTGGQHRSVYVVEAVARRLAGDHPSILTRHNELPETSLTQM